MDYTTILAVGILLVAVFGLGPSRIPQLASAIGKAKRSFENASKGIDEVEINEPPLIRTAHDLGIQTKGKTKEQIASEIAEKT